jgi:hypothetical protein
MSYKVSPYDVWVMANTIRIHFNAKSDVSGMLYSRFPVEKFEKAPERFVCKRISENILGKRNIAMFISSNLVLDPSIWFHSLESDDCRRRYIEARKTLDAPVHSIGNLLKGTSFDRLKSGDPLPDYVSGLMCGKYTPEQICILDVASPFIKCTGEKKQNVVVSSMTNRLCKYKSFCTLKDVEQKNTILTLIENSKGV